MESSLQMDGESLANMALRMGATELVLSEGQIAFALGAKKIVLSAVRVAGRVSVDGLPLEIASVAARADGVEIRFTVGRAT